MPVSRYQTEMRKMWIESVTIKTQPKKHSIWTIRADSDEDYSFLNDAITKRIIDNQEAAKGGGAVSQKQVKPSQIHTPPRKSLCYICGKKTKFGSGYCKKHEPAKAVR